MTDAAGVNSALVFVAWARVWSPLIDDTLRAEAWQQLELPGTLAEHGAAFMRHFVVALPQPPAPLLMHAALAQDGGVVREDFVRVMEYLDVEHQDQGRLPPDHLACACELLAMAIEAGEPVIVDGLRERYLRPWCATVLPRLGDAPALQAVVEQFAADLSAI